jgi:HTH-type transcriptional regulator, sugar sensing transcriptional regulator
MKNDILEEIGLSNSEKKVYLALLELGDSTRGDLVNKSGVSGSKIYDLLEKLQNKGLVSVYIENKIKHFKPTNPSQILNYLEEKKKKFVNIERQTKQLIPSLLASYNSSKEEQEIEIVKGLRGLEVIFREQVDALKPGEVNYVIGGTKGTGEEIIEAFFQKIHLMREKKKIKTKMLYNISQKESVKELYSSKQFPHSETRFIQHTSPVSINIYHDKVFIIIFGKEITAVYIKSKDVANSFLEYFNLMWKLAKN